MRITFAGNKIISDIKVYEDADCLIPFVKAPNPNASGTFVTGGKITASDGVQVTEIDIYVDRYNGAPFDINSYDIFYREGDTLYFSYEDADDARERPNTLNYERAFHKE